MDEFSQANVEMPIKGEQRPVLLMTPPSKVEFPAIEISPTSILAFGVGVSQEVWLREGDGMTFDLSIRTFGRPEPVQVYFRYADPKHILED